MLQTSQATCNWPRQQCHLRNIRGSIVSGLSAKEVCGNVLTGDVAAIAKVSGLEVFAVFQDSNVTCGTFAEASSADWSQKKGAGMFLPVQLVFSRLIVVTAGVFSNTLMSPVEDSRKHRQRTGPKESFGNVLTGYSSITCTKFLKRLAIGQDSNVTCGVFVEASSADGPRKKGAGMFLPVIPVFSAENTHSDLQLAKTAMSPAEHSRKHRQRTVR
jgi:hypothetical protein